MTRMPSGPTGDGGGSESVTRRVCLDDGARQALRRPSIPDLRYPTHGEKPRADITQRHAQGMSQSFMTFGIMPGPTRATLTASLTAAGFKVTNSPRMVPSIQVRVREGTGDEAEVNRLVALHAPNAEVMPLARQSCTSRATVRGGRSRNRWRVSRGHCDPQRFRRRSHLRSRAQRSGGRNARLDAASRSAAARWRRPEDRPPAGPRHGSRAPSPRAPGRRRHGVRRRSGSAR